MIDISKLYKFYEQKRKDAAQKRDEIAALRYENKALRLDNENLLARTDEFAAIIVSLVRRDALTPDEDATISALLHEAK